MSALSQPARHIANVIKFEIKSFKITLFNLFVATLRSWLRFSAAVPTGSRYSHDAKFTNVWLMNNCVTFSMTSAHLSCQGLSWWQTVALLHATGWCILPQGNSSLDRYTFSLFSFIFLLFLLLWGKQRLFVYVRVKRSMGQFNDISDDMTWVTECFTIKQGGVWANIVKQTVPFLGVVNWNQNQHWRVESVSWIRVRYGLSMLAHQQLFWSFELVLLHRVWELWVKTQVRMTDTLKHRLDRQQHLL